MIDKLAIGRHTYGKPQIRSWDVETVCRIGSFCSIADNVTIFLGGNHRQDRVSTFPFPEFFSGHSEAGETHCSKGDVIIGNDVWIGSGSSILSGVIIEDGCVIGAHAVIAGHVPAYSVVVGNPGKVIKKRFTDERVASLLEIAWWNWSMEKILDNIILLCSPNIDGFIERHGVNA